MSNPPVARVRYYPGQYLRSQDFTAEQQYHLAMRRRHLIAHHRFGIVSGLDITLHDGRPVVEAGMAIDGYGREIVLPERTPLDMPRAFTARATDELQVWIAYDLLGTEPAPPGYASCSDGAETTYRLSERPVLRYTVPDLDHPDPRRPATVPTGDHEFGPARTPPDDPTHDWPVYLGTVTRAREGGTDTYTIDTDGRPLAGLVGEMIESVSGRTSVQVGAERDDDPFRFAVRVHEAEGDPEVPRLSVLRDGDVAVVGRTALLGNVEIEGIVEIEAGPVVDDLAELPGQPWTLSQVADADGHRELRLAMEQTDAADEEVVIGSWTTRTNPDGSETEEFTPCLTVRSDCSVTVHGDLIVDGTLFADNRRPVEFGTQAYSVLNAAFLSGVAGAANLIDQYHGGPIGALRFRGGLAAAGATPPDARALADRLATEAGLADELADALRQRHPEAATALRSALDREP